ncbi:MAG TPA: hypothetical protein PLC04_07690 [Candidatus Kapabacteria bacterium]|nr:hypothetical protein [Candidatus Kapabacteria bacterium]
MKKTAIIWLAFFLAFAVGCKNDSTISNKVESDTLEYFTIKIVALDNIDCHLPEIVFIGDTTGISKMLDDTTYIYNKIAFERDPYNYHFLVKDLSDSLNVKDLTIRIKFRIPLQSEYGFCTALGPTYPLLIIVSASKME